MRVLLSIKPEYVDKIFDGTKKYEFRRTIFKNKAIKTVVVYASSPLQRVVGEFEIDVIFKEDLDYLWAITEEHAGISKDYFYEYFSEKEQGFAIKIKETKRYENPLLIQEEFNVNPPQSFLYLN